jgi:hypothetical protein
MNRLAAIRLFDQGLSITLESGAAVSIRSPTIELVDRIGRMAEQPIAIIEALTGLPRESVQELDAATVMELRDKAIALYLAEHDRLAEVIGGPSRGEDGPEYEKAEDSKDGLVRVSHALVSRGHDLADIVHYPLSMLGTLWRQTREDMAMDRAIMARTIRIAVWGGDDAYVDLMTDLSGGLDGGPAATKDDDPEQGWFRLAGKCDSLKK